MTQLSCIALLFVLGDILASLALPLAIDGEANSLTQEAGLQDDFCMLQMPGMRLDTLRPNEGNHSVHLVEAATKSMGKRMSDHFLESAITVACIVLGLCLFLRIVHGCIQSAFQSLPGVSCVLFSALLGEFCSIVLPVLWRSTLDEIDDIGVWAVVISYLATMLLIFTPVMLGLPTQVMPKLSPHRDSGTQSKIAVMYVIVFMSQMLSSIAIFQLAPSGFLFEGLVLEYNTRFTPTFAGAVMTTLLYLLLSWCSLSVIYECMCPDIFGCIFPSMCDDRVKSNLEKMKAQVQAISSQSSEQKVKNVSKTLSSAIDDLYDDLPKEGVGITGSVMAVQATIDREVIGYWFRYFIYFLYVVAAVVHAAILGVRLADLIAHKCNLVLTLICVLIGIPLMFVFFALLIALVVKCALSTGAATENLAELGSRSASPIVTTESGYLPGLCELQREIEARIRKRKGLEGILGADDPDVLISKGDLASTLFKRGDFESAAKLHKEIWEGNQHNLGPESRETLIAMDNFASDLWGQGDHKSAEKLYLEAWQIRARTLGTEHPDTRSSKFRLERCTEKINWD